MKKVIEFSAVHFELVPLSQYCDIYKEPFIALLRARVSASLSVAGRTKKLRELVDTAWVLSETITGDSQALFLAKPSKNGRSPELDLCLFSCVTRKGKEQLDEATWERVSGSQAPLVRRIQQLIRATY